MNGDNSNKKEETLHEPASKMTRWYDDVMTDHAFEAFYDHTEYANFGYWATTGSTAGEAAESLVARLLEFVPEKEGKVLDVACGKGASSRHLLRYFPADRITSINISEKQLERVRINAPGVNALCMDAVNLDFPDASFDLILCVEAAFHFHTRERFLQEAFRVLKPGGRIILSDILMTYEADERRAHRPVENHLLDPLAYQGLLERIGFDNCQVMDSTEKCFNSFFRYMVRYVHEKLLKREIDVATLQRRLVNIYEHAEDLTYYLLVCACKPAPATVRSSHD